MQFIDSRWLIPIVAITSDRLFNAELEQCISDNTEYKSQFSQAVLDYQYYTGSQLRDEDIEHAIDYWFDGGLGSPVIFSLNKLARLFLFWQGDCFEVHASLLQEWLSLSSYIDPAWIIAAAFHETFKVKLSIDALYPLLEKQCHLALPKRQDKSIFSDNHVHL